LPRGLQAAHVGLEALDARAERLGVVGADAAQVVEVAPGEERLLGRGDDHAGDVVLLGREPVDRRAHRRDVVRVHRVRRLVGVVEREDDHAVVAARVLDGGSHD